MRQTTHRADYSHRFVGGVLCIVDHDNGRSVTNDAENVIADLAAAGIDVDRQPVIYRDTMGQWDQLTTSGGKFAGFRSLGGTADQDIAIAAALRFAAAHQ